MSETFPFVNSDLVIGAYDDAGVVIFASTKARHWASFREVETVSCGDGSERTAAFFTPDVAGAVFEGALADGMAVTIKRIDGSAFEARRTSGDATLVPGNATIKH